MAWISVIGCLLVIGIADCRSVNKHLSFDISKEVATGVGKRAFDVPVDNKLTYYRTTLSIGNPAQHVAVQIDTGSSDLWVMSSKNPFCSPRTSPQSASIKCDRNFMFNYGQSTSFKWNTSEPKFSILYGDSTFANGSYCTDTLRLGNSVTLDSANFAVATRANSSEAVWGIGMVSTEAMGRHIGRDGSIYPTYPNIPQQLKDSGSINALAYSLWLSNIDAASGKLLFGAVDHAKYTGKLQTVPMVSTYQGLEQPIDFSIMVHGVSIYDTTSNVTAQVASFSLPFLLDSGTTYSMLPKQILRPVMESIGAVFSNNLGVYLVPCNSLASQSGLVFDISGIQLKVPFSELLIPLSQASNRQPQCMIGLYPAVGSNFILGDTFLRSAYVVYNLEKKEISLAQAQNSDEEDIENISEDAEVPGAVQAPSYTSTDVQASFTLQPTSMFTRQTQQTKRAHKVNGSSSNAARTTAFSTALLYILCLL